MADPHGNVCIGYSVFVLTYSNKVLIDVYVVLQGSVPQIGSSGDTNKVNDKAPPPLKRCCIEEIPNDAEVKVDVRVWAKSNDYVMSKDEMMEFEANDFQMPTGEDDSEGSEEFIMHMLDDWNEDA